MLKTEKLDRFYPKSCSTNWSIQLLVQPWPDQNFRFLNRVMLAPPLQFKSWVKSGSVQCWSKSRSYSDLCTDIQIQFKIFLRGFDPWIQWRSDLNSKHNMLYGRIWSRLGNNFKIQISEIVQPKIKKKKNIILRSIYHKVLYGSELISSIHRVLLPPLP